jgi:hypothetical protein
MTTMFLSLCEPWPLPPSGCPDLTGSPEVTGAAVMAASEILWDLSGHQYGACEVLFRPCRQSCSAGSPWAQWWDGASWPHGTPYPGSTLWWNAVCGTCRDACACSSADTLTLPGPVRSITEVLVDGVVLDAGAYALYDGRRLVRTDGERWPLCQDWAVPVSGVGAWSIEAVFGWEVPVAGWFAVAELAKVYAEWCSSGVCRLPAYTTQVSRQGVTQSFPSATELAQLGLTGLGFVDRFLQAVNPAGLRAGTTARIWNPDDFGGGPRVPGGVR